ncbi:MAG: AraC family transcriptional regulator [Chloroflexi bacterium]|nr:MAG: AraC family transcriptional regulator [Chloroflexota bacterium]
MEPRIVHREQLLLLGLSFYGDPFQSSAGWTEENEIGRLWKRFTVFLENYKNLLPQIVNPTASYEVHIESDERVVTGNYEIFVGVAIQQIKQLPVTTLVKVLPATDYAVFTLQGEQIISDWHKLIYVDWLPQSGYEFAYDYSFQLYDHRFKGLDNLAESTLDVYMPVRKIAS